MPNPKRKHSKARRDKRRGANSKMCAPTLAVCPHCKKLRLPHRVCPHCGYYKGKPVVVLETVEKKKK